MLTKLKARTPTLALILLVFSLGYTFAHNKVVVVPLGDSGMPGGAVIAFNGVTCPSGWAEFVNARGRTLVGLQNGGTLLGTRHNAMADLETLSHEHVWANYNGVTKRWEDGFGTLIYDWINGMDSEGQGFYPIVVDIDTGSDNLFTNSNSDAFPYLQILMCQKL